MLRRFCDPRLQPLFSCTRLVAFASLIACGGASGDDSEAGAGDESSSDATGEIESSGSAGETGETDASSGDTSSTTGDESGETGATGDIELSLSENPDMSIAPFANIVASDASEVRIVVSQQGTVIFTRVVTDIEPGDASSLRTFVWGLEADTEYEIMAEADLPAGLAQSETLAWTTGSLPEFVPSLSISDHVEGQAHEGLVIFGSKTEGNQVYVGANPEGKIVWYHATGGTGNKLNGDVKQLDDGRLLLFQPAGIRIIEPWGELVTEIDTTFHHDLTPLPNGNFLILGRVNKTINVVPLGGDVSVQVDTLEEITPSGAQVRFWSADDHLDTQYYPSELSQNGPPYDWTHANAAYYDAQEDRVLLSARHLHWIVGINWSSGEVDWKLGPGGDFTLDGVAEDWFYAPHAPMADGEGRLLVYDNGNERPGGSAYSRGVLIGYDEVAMTASVEWEYQIIPQTLFLGDADRLSNGNVLLTAGGTSTSLEEVALIEVSDDDPAEVVWRMVIDNGGNTFRATHLDTL